MHAGDKSWHENNVFSHLPSLGIKKFTLVV